MLCAYILVAFCLKLSMATIMNCSQNNNQSDICFTRKEGYVNPSHVILNTALFLRKIVEIDDDKHSITIQMGMTTFWSDPGLDLTNTTTT